MELLIKQHAYFFGEILHPRKISQNYLYRFLNLTQQYLFPDFSATIKTNRMKVSVGFFLPRHPLKNNISNEEERFNFNY